MNPFEPHNILIIDDEEAILKMLTSVFTRKGHIIDTAKNGEEGIRKVQSNEYDFIITDIKMPGISGEEILTEVRRIKGDTMPVVGMSGTPWMLDESLFDAVLIKPFSQKELFDAIRSIVPSF